MQGSIAYHSRRRQRPFRVAGRQLSPRAVTTLPIRSALGARPVFADPRGRSMWEVPFFGVVMTPTNRHGAHRPPASPVTVMRAVSGIQGGVQQVLAGGKLGRARTATIRTKLVNIPGRVSSSARTYTVHLPARSRRQDRFMTMFDAVQAPPEAA